MIKHSGGDERKIIISKLVPQLWDHSPSDRCFISAVIPELPWVILSPHKLLESSLRSVSKTSHSLLGGAAGLSSHWCLVVSRRMFELNMDMNHLLLLPQE